MGTGRQGADKERENGCGWGGEEEGEEVSFLCREASQRKTVKGEDTRGKGKREGEGVAGSTPRRKRAHRRKGRKKKSVPCVSCVSCVGGEGEVVRDRGQGKEKARACGGGDSGTRA